MMFFILQLSRAALCMNLLLAVLYYQAPPPHFLQFLKRSLILDLDLTGWLLVGISAGHESCQVARGRCLSVLPICPESL
jgi:hypothetical protein